MVGVRLRSSFALCPLPSGATPEPLLVLASAYAPLDHGSTALAT